jgi:hypothetical protein
MGFVAVGVAILAIPAISRSDTLFVSNSGDSVVGEYTTSGATVNYTLITGLILPHGTVVPVPEGTLLLLGAGLGGLAAIRACRPPTL